MSALLRRARGLSTGQKVVGLTLVAAALRLPFLFRAPADLDETWSWYFVELLRSGRDLLDVFLVGLDGPLFVAVDIGVAVATGSVLPALRVPSALLGIVSVPLAWAALRRLHDGPTALRASALTALSPFLVYYSMQARPYAQLLATCLLFSWAAARPAQARRLAGWIAVVLAALLAVASHYYAIVFLGCWYGTRAAAAMLLRRWRAAGAEVAEGLLVLVAVAPLLALLARRLRILGVGYWQTPGLDLASVLSDEVFLAGTSLGDHPAAWVGLVAIALPFVLTAWRRPRVFLEHPWLLLGPAMPVVASAVGGLIGQRLLFYPRAYIGSTPFLLAAIAVLLPIAFRRARVRRAYAAALLVPFLISTVLVSVASPRHPLYRERGILAELVAGVAALAPQYDRVLVHHWFLTQLVAYHHPEPRRVIGPGMFRREEAATIGEARAALLDVDALPREDRLLLMRNGLATHGSDPDGFVLSALSAHRPIVRRLPCRTSPVEGESILCEELVLLGPDRRSSGGAAAPRAAH